MRLIIEKMTIDNFKGCRHLDLDLSEKLTIIGGMNGAGKTTIADAFAWVMWNKDSKGNAPGSDSFRDKPLDDDGKEIHYIETSVEIRCKLDGKPFDLKRTQTENWVKKRGFTDSIYQGNVSTYWVNGVETKLSEFKARISMIAEDDKSRLLSSLHAFNGLEWKKRRQQLIELSGTDIDAELLKKPVYAALARECEERDISIDQLKKSASERRKRISDDLKSIPIRIDEAKKALPRIEEREIIDAEYMIDDCKADIEKIERYIDQEKAASDQSGARSKILTMQQEMVAERRRVNDEYQSGKALLQRKADESGAAVRLRALEMQAAKHEQEAAEREQKSHEAKRDELRESFKRVRNEEPIIDSICPCCGQLLTSEMIEATKAKYIEEKKKKLDAIKADGAIAAKAVEECIDKAVAAKMKVGDIAEKLAAAEKERDAAFDDLRKYPTAPDYENNQRIAELQAEIDAASGTTSSASETKIEAYKKRIAELQSIIDSKRAILARRDSGYETQKRIDILEEEQKESGAKLGEVENLIILCEKFIQERCGALEESINSRFPSVRWKLFDIQINGGINDCCMCMIPCDSGLVAYESANTAAQVCADCEIVEVLSKHYGVSLPLFIDNAERVNVLPEMDTQTIQLYVTNDAKLSIRKDA